MYVAIADNLTHLGGPMGSEYITTFWHKYFSSITKAKNYCEKYYGKPILWKGKKFISSGDLGWVMFAIRLVKTEN